MNDRRIDAMSVSKAGVGYIMLNKPVRCFCGRAAIFVVNRDGKSRCVYCDGEYVRRGAGVEERR